MKITNEKISVICPLCGVDTKRWKLVLVEWRTKILPSGRRVLDSIEKSKTNFPEFENRVLQEHFRTCENYGGSGGAVKQIYAALV